MRLLKLTLRHFRNINFAALDLEGRQQFLAGPNGQGKTNLLEAAGFLTAQRSFRTTDNRLLIGHGQRTAAIAAEIEHERMGRTRVTVKLHHTGRELWCDQERITKLADYLGRFPTVAFTAQDIQLVRGAPAGRRRWLDHTLAAMDGEYLRLLQTFTRALAGRNALLRSGRADDRELTAFEQALAPAASGLITRRAAGLQTLGQALTGTYSRLCADAEPAGLQYEPSFPEPDAEALQCRLEAGRPRDRQFRTTLVGPHRDDFRLLVRHTAARDFASDGQQRSLALALRLAQAAWYREHSGVSPVLLADDVLGELDAGRRQRFWAALDPAAQMIATGTHLPDAELGDWQIFDVADGVFTARDAPTEAAG